MIGPLFLFLIGVAFLIAAIGYAFNFNWVWVIYCISAAVLNWCIAYASK